MVARLSKQGLKKATNSIFDGFVSSYVGALESQSAHYRLVVALRSYRLLGDSTKHSLNRYAFVKSGLDCIDENKEENWEFFHVNSMIVFQNSIFDVFLSDINRLLYHAFPDKISSETKMSAQEILAADDLKSLQDQVIENKVVSQSYKTMSERVKRLIKNHSLKISLKASIYDKLDDLNEVRNKVVHANRIADFKTTKGGYVKIKTITTDGDELQKHYNQMKDIQSFLVANVYESIIKNIIKSKLTKRNIYICDQLKRNWIS